MMKKRLLGSRRSLKIVIFGVIAFAMIIGFIIIALAPLCIKVIGNYFLD